MERKQNTLADLGLLYAAAIWGSTFILVKQSLEAVDPVILVGYRFLLAALILGVILRWRGISLFKDFRAGGLMGVLLWLIYTPQTIGLGFTSATNSAFITGLFVVFVPFFAFLFLRRRPTATQLLAVGIALAGLWLLTGGPSNANLGDWLTLITAMANAGQILLADRLMKSGAHNPFLLAFQQFFTTGVLSLVAGSLLGLPFTVSDPSGWSAIVFLALFPTLSAFVVQLLAQRHTQPVKATLIFSLEPVFAALFAWLVAGESFSPATVWGSGMIFMAMLIAGPDKSEGHTS